ncbi:hypothetical protein WJ438_40260 [Streptomyces sp. GD-15H]|uniref:hypothetical protein n=1 Tax=Streptomyces sp. GD-15H TaxID=3129112 RepID=UPI0032555936
MRNTFKRTLALTAAGAALTGVLSATTAAAVTETPGSANRDSVSAQAASSVIVRIPGYVRQGPSSDHNIAYPVRPGQWLQGVCWLYGGHEYADGISNNKWVQLSDGNYVPVVLLQSEGHHPKC